MRFQPDLHGLIGLEAHVRFGLRADHDVTNLPSPLYPRNRTFNTATHPAPDGPRDASDLHRLTSKLVEYRQLPTDDRGLSGFDKWLGPQVDVRVMCINADTGDHDRAQEADDHNLQMCSPVAGMHRVIHSGFCPSALAVATPAQAKGRFARNNSGIVLRLESQKICEHHGHRRVVMGAVAAIITRAFNPSPHDPTQPAQSKRE